MAEQDDRQGSERRPCRASSDATARSWSGSPASSTSTTRRPCAPRCSRRRRTTRSVVVDLADVRFIDSTTLGVLVEARARLGGARSCSPRPRSRRGARWRSPGSTASSPCATGRGRARSRAVVAADEVDELYGLPLDEFTAARNALAKRLRADGERERADEVKALAKPSVPVMDGQPARAPPRGERPEAARGGRVAPPCAGARVRGRRPATAPGGGEEERELVARLRREARDLLTESGRPAGDALLERVAATLSSAAVDPEARPLLEAGRLTEEVEASGFDAFAGMALPAAGNGPGEGEAPAKERAAPAKAKPGEGPPRRRSATRPPSAAGGRGERAAPLRSAGGRPSSTARRAPPSGRPPAPRRRPSAPRSAAAERRSAAASARAAADEARAEADRAT